MSNPNPAHKRNILPGLQVPTDVSPELQKFLQAVKEHIEVYTGSKGQPGERFVTVQDLKDIGLANYVVKRGRAELGDTAEQAAASRAAASTRTTSSALSTDTTGAKDNDILRYRALSGKWQRYSLEDFIQLMLGLLLEEDGDIITKVNGEVVRLAAGNEDDVLIIRDGVPSWDRRAGAWAAGAWAEGAWQGTAWAE